MVTADIVSCNLYQIKVTNPISIIEKGVIPETTRNFFDGYLHLGFNISRTS